jgi:hypothetical protein
MGHQHALTGFGSACFAFGGVRQAQAVLCPRFCETL